MYNLEEGMAELLRLLYLHNTAEAEHTVLLTAQMFQLPIVVVM
jgi:hypothetical protein